MGISVENVYHEMIATDYHDLKKFKVLNACA